jgi:hypothetical protein
MIKKKIIFLIILLILFTAGCSVNETEDNILTPYPDEDLSSNKDTSDTVQFSDKEVTVKSDEEGEGGTKQNPEGYKNMPDEEENSEDNEDTINYIGSWRRIGLFVDGSSQEFAPDKLVFKEDSFVSSTPVCTAQGKATLTGNQLTLYDVTDNCPTHPEGNVTYTISISDDCNTLTMVTVYSGIEIREVYQRIK